MTTVIVKNKQKCVNFRKFTGVIVVCCFVLILLRILCTKQNANWILCKVSDLQNCHWLICIVFEVKTKWLLEQHLKPIQSQNDLRKIITDGVKPQQGNLRLVLRLFESRPRQSLG